MPQDNLHGIFGLFSKIKENSKKIRRTCHNYVMPCLLGGREVRRGKEFNFFYTFHCLVGVSLMELNFH